MRWPHVPEPYYSWQFLNDLIFSIYSVSWCPGKSLCVTFSNVFWGFWSFFLILEGLGDRFEVHDFEGYPGCGPGCACYRPMSDPPAPHCSEFTMLLHFSKPSFNFPFIASGIVKDPAWYDSERLSEHSIVSWASAMREKNPVHS